MKTKSKSEILEAILDSQDLGEKTKIHLMDCLTTKTYLGENTDPLTQYLYNTVMEEETGSGIEQTLDYAISQLSKAKIALSRMRLELYDIEVIE